MTILALCRILTKVGEQELERRMMMNEILLLSSNPGYP